MRLFDGMVADGTPIADAAGLVSITDAFGALTDEAMLYSAPGAIAGTVDPVRYGRASYASDSIVPVRTMSSAAGAVSAPAPESTVLGMPRHIALGIVVTVAIVWAAGQ